MKNMSFSCAFRVEISGLLPVKSSLSSSLPVPLRGVLLRRNATRSRLKSLAHRKTLNKNWDMESSMMTMYKGLSFQSSVEKTSTTVLHQKLLDLRPTMSGTHVAVNSSLRSGF
jgi:hypothetical protein